MKSILPCCKQRRSTTQITPRHKSDTRSNANSNSRQKKKKCENEHTSTDTASRRTGTKWKMSTHDRRTNDRRELKTRLFAQIKNESSKQYACKTYRCKEKQNVVAHTSPITSGLTKIFPSSRKKVNQPECDARQTPKVDGSVGGRKKR